MGSPVSRIYLSCDIGTVSLESRERKGEKREKVERIFVKMLSKCGGVMTKREREYA